MGLVTSLDLFIIRIQIHGLISEWRSRLFLYSVWNFKYFIIHIRTAELLKMVYWKEQNLRLMPNIRHFLEYLDPDPDSRRTCGSGSETLFLTIDSIHGNYSYVCTYWTGISLYIFLPSSGGFPLYSEIFTVVHNDKILNEPPHLHQWATTSPPMSHQMSQRYPHSWASLLLKVTSVKR